MTNEAEAGHLFIGHSHGFFSEVCVQFFLLMLKTGYWFFPYLLSTILSVSVDKSL